MTEKHNNLVSTQWLSDHMEDENLVVLDASWYKPEYGRVGWIEYKADHIPRAGFFDMEEVVDLDHELSNMLPPPDEFAEAVGELGIGNETMVVLYDTHEKGFYSAARVWWLFRVMGHDKVAVLDGGFPKWLAEKRPVEHGLPEDPDEQDFVIKPRPGLVKGLDEMKAASLEGLPQIVDARSPERFRGEFDEGVPELRNGRIPGSKNVFYEDVFNPDATLKDRAGLENLFREAAIDLDKPMVTSCNSGITACILTLALDAMGHEDIPVYDASWAQWGRDPSVDIEVG